MGFKEDVAFEPLRYVFLVSCASMFNWLHLDYFLNTPIVLCLKHFKTLGPLIFLVGYPSLIRSEVYDFGPMPPANFPGQRRGTLYFSEKITGFQTGPNESHWVDLMMGIIRAIHHCIQNHFSSDFWGQFSKDRECGWCVWSPFDTRWSAGPSWHIIYTDWSCNSHTQGKDDNGASKLSQQEGLGRIRSRELRDDYGKWFW